MVTLKCENLFAEKGLKEKWTLIYRERVRGCGKVAEHFEEDLIRG